MICSSASCSVRPSVISVVSCSPALLPMAASCTSAASTSLASRPGTASMRPLSMMMESHSVWPLQGALPTILASKRWKESSRATERDTMSALAPAPFRFTT